MRKVAVSPSVLHYLRSLSVAEVQNFLIRVYVSLVSGMPVTGESLTPSCPASATQFAELGDAVQSWAQLESRSNASIIDMSFTHILSAARCASMIEA